MIERVPEAEQRTDADTFRALHEIAVAVGGLLEPGPLAELVVDRARDLMGVGGAVLRWWEPEAGVMRMLANQQPHEVPLDIPPDQGSMGRVFTTRRPVRVNDYPNWPHAAPWAVRDGARAALFVPLLVRQEPVGVLGVISYRPHSFTEQDELVLALLAAQAAPALEAARLHAEVERHGLRQEMLAGLGRLALAGGSVEELLREGVRLAPLHGGLSPLRGFMDSEAYRSVVETRHLPGGKLAWTIPITLWPSDCSAAAAATCSASS